MVPSLRTFIASSSDNSAQFALRGQVASDTLLGISQPVGLYEDQVNIPHPFGANNGFFDLSRIEVLNGPRLGLQNGIAELADVGQRGVAPRDHLGIERWCLLLGLDLVDRAVFNRFSCL